MAEVKWELSEAHKSQRAPVGDEEQKTTNVEEAKRAAMLNLAIKSQRATYQAGSFEDKRDSGKEV